MKLNKLVCIMIFLCNFMLYGAEAQIEKLFKDFANKNSINFIGCMEGKFSDNPEKQMIALFYEDLTNYKVYYFTFNNSCINEIIEISNFCHEFNSSVFDFNVEKYNSFIEKYVFINDLTGDGYDEVILDNGYDKMCPLIFKCINNNFEQILSVEGFPVSNVILPGAPDVYETWKLKYFDKGKIILKRFQSDLIQYINYNWDNNKKSFVIPDDYDYFSNTGFISSNINDFSFLNYELSETYLKDLNSKQLRILRNAIYAKYGRKFNSWDLVDEFLQCKWYIINSDFSDNDLTETDKKNIKMIQKYENKRGVYKPIPWELTFSN